VTIAKLAHGCNCFKFDASQKNPGNRKSGASSKNMAHETFDKTATRFIYITFDLLFKNMMHFKKLWNTVT